MTLLLNLTHTTCPNHSLTSAGVIGRRGGGLRDTVIEMTWSIGDPLLLKQLLVILKCLQAMAMLRTLLNAEKLVPNFYGES